MATSSTPPSPASGDALEDAWSAPLPREMLLRLAMLPLPGHGGPRGGGEEEDTPPFPDRVCYRRACGRPTGQRPARVSPAAAVLNEAVSNSEKSTQLVTSAAYAWALSVCEPLGACL